LYRRASRRLPRSMAMMAIERVGAMLYVTVQMLVPSNPSVVVSLGPSFARMGVVM